MGAGSILICLAADTFSAEKERGRTPATLLNSISCCLSVPYCHKDLKAGKCFCDNSHCIWF